MTIYNIRIGRPNAHREWKHPNGTAYNVWVSDAHDLLKPRETLTVLTFAKESDPVGTPQPQTLIRGLFSLDAATDARLAELLGQAS